MDLLIKPLSIRADICSTFLSKAKGFMFSFSNKPKIFIFKKEKKVGIHMLFVFKKLIIVWMDKNKRIIEVNKALPFFFNHSNKAKYILEMPYSEKTLKKLLKLKKLTF